MNEITWHIRLDLTVVQMEGSNVSKVIPNIKTRTVLGDAYLADSGKLWQEVSGPPKYEIGDTVHLIGDPTTRVVRGYGLDISDPDQLRFSYDCPPENKETTAPATFYSLNQLKQEDKKSTKLILDSLYTVDNPQKNP